MTGPVAAGVLSGVGVWWVWPHLPAAPTTVMVTAIAVGLAGSLARLLTGRPGAVPLLALGLVAASGIAVDWMPWFAAAVTTLVVTGETGQIGQRQAEADGQDDTTDDEDMVDAEVIDV